MSGHWGAPRHTSLGTEAEQRVSPSTLLRKKEQQQQSLYTVSILSQTVYTDTDTDTDTDTNTDTDTV